MFTAGLHLGLVLENPHIIGAQNSNDFTVLVAGLLCLAFSVTTGYILVSKISVFIFHYLCVYLYKKSQNFIECVEFYFCSYYEEYI